MKQVIYVDVLIIVNLFVNYFLLLTTSKFLNLKLKLSRLILGEILGAMAAIKKSIELGLDCINIYYDYMGIEMWAKGLWKCNKQGTKDYQDFIKENQSKIKINFIKIKGHSGVEGNEEADMLAKKAVGII